MMLKWEREREWGVDILIRGGEREGVFAFVEREMNSKMVVSVLCP